MYHFSSRLLRTLSYTLLPALALFLAFSFTKPFVVEATSVPVFQGFVGQTPTAEPGDHLAGFGYPASVAIDQQGNMYVFDIFANHVKKFDSSGSFTLFFGGYGSGDGEFSAGEVGGYCD